MKTYDKEAILKEGEFYINNNYTQKEAAEILGMARRTFYVHMKKFIEMYPEKAVLIEEKKEQNLKLGQIKGGQNGAPSYTGKHIKFKPYTLTEEQAQQLADTMMKNDLSLRDVEYKYGISKETARENMTLERLGEERYGEFRKFMESHKPQNRK